MSVRERESGCWVNGICAGSEKKSIVFVSHASVFFFPFFFSVSFSPSFNDLLGGCKKVRGHIVLLIVKWVVSRSFAAEWSFYSFFVELQFTQNFMESL